MQYQSFEIEAMLDDRASFEVCDAENFEILFRVDRAEAVRLAAAGTVLGRGSKNRLKFLTLVEESSTSSGVMAAGSRTVVRNGNGFTHHDRRCAAMATPRFRQ